MLKAFRKRKRCFLKELVLLLVLFAGDVDVVVVTVE